ncbi:hypothetical protein [Kitasatospora sp. NPDC001095]
MLLVTTQMGVGKTRAAFHAARLSRNIQLSLFHSLATPSAVADLTSVEAAAAAELARIDRSLNAYAHVSVGELAGWLVLYARQGARRFGQGALLYEVSRTLPKIETPPGFRMSDGLLDKWVAEFENAVQRSGRVNRRVSTKTRLQALIKLLADLRLLLAFPPLPSRVGPARAAGVRRTWACVCGSERLAGPVIPRGPGSSSLPATSQQGHHFGWSLAA